MVFRKPYAFLIKNFKKIHLLMLVMWGYVFYKIVNIRSFISEFISLGTYNKNLEGINTKTGFLLYLSIVLLIVISILLLILLRHKKKPWKIYLIIIAEYLVLIYGLVETTSFFNAYTITDTVSGVFLARDIMNIANIGQFFPLIILILRITGLDLKKFEFNNDEEFLELSSQDREEFEVSIEIDKNTFKRTYNRLKRNIGYVYNEHKLLANSFITILVISLIGYNYYYFAVKHKSYKQGDTYSVGVYDIKINDVYVTDKDAVGNIVEKDSKFVIVKVTMKNKESKKVEPNFSRFRLMNSNNSSNNTIYYDDSFKDIGKGVSDITSLAAGAERQLILVYKVPKDLKNKKFVLYYQEYNGRNDTYLRKIKLTTTDISKIEETKKYNVGEEIVFKTLNNEEKEITFDSVDIQDTITYTKYMCVQAGNCGMNKITTPKVEGTKVLRIGFASSDYEGKEFIDFTSRYGIINYVDNEDKKHTAEVKSVIDVSYEGKEIYLKIDQAVADAKEISIDYKIRNKEYVVKVK